MYSACSMKDGMITFKILTDKPTIKRLLERFRRRWKDNIGIGLKEIGANLRE